VSRVNGARESEANQSRSCDWLLRRRTKGEPAAQFSLALEDGADDVVAWALLGYRHGNAQSECHCAGHAARRTAMDR
jgi:hypothetical protein